jgi:hypothetical protein
VAYLSKHCIALIRCQFTAITPVSQNCFLSSSKCTSVPDCQLQTNRDEHRCTCIR